MRSPESATQQFTVSTIIQKGEREREREQQLNNKTVWLCLSQKHTKKKKRRGLAMYKLLLVREMIIIQTIGVMVEFLIHEWSGLLN